MYGSMKTLDIDAVHAFVMVADLKSFTRAAEAIDSTQSAVSLKIKRLEDTLGRRLLERTPRRVQLSAEGSVFLASARNLVAAHQGAIGSFDVPRRRLVLGISHHIVGAELPILLKYLKTAHPNLIVELRVSTSRGLLDAFDQRDIEGAIVLRHDNRRLDGEVLFQEGFGWMASRDFVHQQGQPLHLATQAEPCSVRSMAITALGEADIPWTEVFVGGGVMTIGAAVSAGLAVAVMSRRVAPEGLIDVGPQLGLPALPLRDVVLHSSASSEQSRTVLATLAAALRSTAL